MAEIDASLTGSRHECQEILGEPDGLVKIVAERDGPLLGVHIVGPWATELIAEGYLSVDGRIIYQMNEFTLRLMAVPR